MELTYFSLDKERVLKEVLENSLSVMFFISSLVFENIGMLSR